MRDIKKQRIKGESYYVVTATDMKNHTRDVFDLARKPGSKVLIELYGKLCFVLNHIDEENLNKKNTKENVLDSVREHWKYLDHSKVTKPKNIINQSIKNIRYERP